MGPRVQDSSRIHDFCGYRGKGVFVQQYRGKGVLTEIAEGRPTPRCGTVPVPRCGRAAEVAAEEPRVALTVVAEGKRARCGGVGVALGSPLAAQR